MQSYVLVLNGIVCHIVIMFIAFVVFYVLRIKYKMTDEYKLKKYFQELALKCNKNCDTNNIYHKYCVKNRLIQKQKNDFILTDKGLNFLKLVYDENYNYVISYSMLISLIISSIAFVVSISDLLIKIIEKV